MFFVLVCNGKVVRRIRKALGNIQLRESLRSSSSRLYQPLLQNISELFLRFRTSVSRERKITKTSLLKEERMEMAQILE